MTILRDLFGPGTWGTGGNLVAAVLLGGLGVAFGYLFRDRIGPKLAAWWTRHASDGFGDELAALRRHVTDELAEHRKDLARAHDAIHRRLDDHADLIRASTTTKGK